MSTFDATSLLNQFHANLAAITTASMGTFTRSAYRFKLDKEPDSAPDGMYFIDLPSIAPFDRKFGTGENICTATVSVRVAYNRPGGSLNRGDRQAVNRSAASDSMLIADVCENPDNYNSSASGISIVVFNGLSRAFDVGNTEIWETRFEVTFRTDLHTSPVQDFMVASLIAASAPALSALSVITFASGTGAVIPASATAREQLFFLDKENLAGTVANGVDVVAATGPGSPVWRLKSGDLSFDGTTTGATQLTGFVTTNVPNGTNAFVTSRLMTVRLDKSSTLTPDNVYIFAATAGNWLRESVQEPTYLGQTYWAVDSVDGDDDNLGYGATQAAADLFPLKTLREANARMLGSNLTSQVFWHLLNDVPLSDAMVMHNVRSANGLGFPTMIGTKTQIGGDYVVTSFAPADHSAGGGGTGYLVNAINIGDSANVGHLVETTDGAICCWIQDNPSGGQVRVTPPNTADPVAGSTGASASLDSRTVRVYSLTRLPTYPFGPAAGFNALGWCKFGYGSADPNFAYGQIGPASPFITRCESEGAILNGGVNGEWSACMFNVNGITPTVLSMHQSIVHFCGVRGGDISTPGLYLQSGSVLIGESVSTDAAALDVQNSTIKVESAQLVATSWPLSAFNCSIGTGVIRVVGEGAVRVLNIYGRGNTVGALSTTGRGGIYIVGTANFGTTAAHIASVAGVGVDIPFSDSAGTFISAPP